MLKTVRTTNNGPQSPKRCSSTPRPTERPKWAGVARCSTSFGKDVLTFEPLHSLVKEQPTFAAIRLRLSPSASLDWVVPPNAGNLAQEPNAKLFEFGDDPSRTTFFVVPRASSLTRRQWPSFEEGALSELEQCAGASRLDQSCFPSATSFVSFPQPLVATGEADNTSLNRPVKARH